MCGDGVADGGADGGAIAGADTCAVVCAVRIADVGAIRVTNGGAFAGAKRCTDASAVAGTYQCTVASAIVIAHAGANTQLRRWRHKSCKWCVRAVCSRAFRSGS